MQLFQTVSTSMRAARALVAGLALLVTACGSGSATPGGDGAPVITAATWTSIYADALAPAAKASCTGGSTCHSSLAQAGGTVSNFICTDKAGCYASLKGDSRLVRAQDTANPAASPLVRELRKAGGVGKMPKDSPFVFQTEDIQRIEDWIAAGAKDD